MACTIDNCQTCYYRDEKPCPFEKEEPAPLQLSQRGKAWLEFSARVLNHIENYTVPQYGDKGEDQVTEYSPEECALQIKKYISRYGKNARQGQQELDLLKIAHYAQLTLEKLEEAEHFNMGDLLAAMHRGSNGA